MAPTRSQKPTTAAPAKRRHQKTTTARWDELQEPIIQNIQSYLEPIDVVRTTVLSKAWHNAWFTIPFLRFKESALGNPETESDRELQSSNFSKLVDDTVTRYARSNILIETFDIQIENMYQKVVSLCQQWIEVVLAAGNGLKEISVYGGPTYANGEKLLSFPPDPRIECRSLLVLKLYGVCIDDQVTHKLLSTCLLIEEVYIYRCKGFEKMEVKNLHRLCVFDMSTRGKEIVEIKNAPSLHSFTYRVPVCDRPAFGFNITASENLRSLVLQNVSIGDECFNQLIAKFPLLQCLTIQDIYLLEKINITCDSLNKLTISWCKKLMDVVVQSSDFRQFSYHCCYGSEWPNFSFPNLTHKQLDASLEVPCPFYNSCLLSLREVVKVSHKLEIAFIDCSAALEIDPNDWRNITLPPESIEELLIRVPSILDTQFSTIMDALLSICHPEYVCAKWRVSAKNDFCKFLRRKLLERENSCCISFDQKCWRHYLKDVEIGLSRKGDSTSQFNMHEMEPLKFPWRCLLDGSKRPRDSLIYRLMW